MVRSITMGVMAISPVCGPGIEIALYFQTMRVLLGRRSQRRNFDIIHAIFSTVMFLSASIFVATNALLGQRTWLTNRSYPGGGSAYMYGPSADLYSLLGSLGVFIIQQMTDVLMVRSGAWK